MRLKEVDINSFIVFYLVAAQYEKLSFSFSGFLVAKGPVIHRHVGDRLVTSNKVRPPKPPKTALISSRL
jgi:hypothetical protein